MVTTISNVLFVTLRRGSGSEVDTRNMSKCLPGCMLRIEISRTSKQICAFDYTCFDVLISHFN